MILLWLASSSMAADLTIIGECPGPVIFDLTDFTPGASVVVLVGEGDGSAPVPAGPCRDSSSGLATLRTFLGPGRDTDPDGRMWLSRTLSEDACGADYVLMDLSDCSVSDSADFDAVTPEEDADCAANPLWEPVDCTTPEWVWTSDRAFTTAETADAARTLWSDHWGLTCSLTGAGWVSTETFTMAGCNDRWYHIGGRYTGDCGGHDGEDVKRLTMDDLGCYDYRGLPM
jgi:hypothetical protein